MKVYFMCVPHCTAKVFQDAEKLGPIMYKAPTEFFFGGSYFYSRKLINDFRVGERKQKL